MRSPRDGDNQLFYFFLVFPRRCHGVLRLLHRTMSIFWYTCCVVVLYSTEWSFCTSTCILRRPWECLIIQMSSARKSIEQKSRRRFSVVKFSGWPVKLIYSFFFQRLRTTHFAPQPFICSLDFVLNFATFPYIFLVLSTSFFPKITLGVKRHVLHL